MMVDRAEQIATRKVHSEAWETVKHQAFYTQSHNVPLSRVGKCVVRGEEKGCVLFCVTHLPKGSRRDLWSPLTAHVHTHERGRLHNDSFPLPLVNDVDTKQMSRLDLWIGIDRDTHVPLSCGSLRDERGSTTFRVDLRSRREDSWRK
jgi:hypothetical protein